MLIDVRGLRGDTSTGYVYAELVERDIAQLLSSLSGLPVSQLGSSSARPEYDFLLGDLPMELKITEGEKLPVEVAKDESGSVPSGVSVSLAPYILYLSNGHGRKAAGSPPAGKLRLLNRRWLIKQAQKTSPSFYRVSPSSTENALVHYVGPFFNGEPNELWLGDMEYVQDASGERWLYDTSTFVPSHKAAGLLRWIHQAYIEGDIT